MKYFFLTCFVLLFTVLSVFAGAPSPTIADLEAAIIQEDYKKANDLAGQMGTARLSAEEDAQVRYYLGLSLLRLGEYVRAQEIFNKLMGARINNELYEKVAVGHVDALYMQGFYEKASKEANSLISRRGSSDMLSLFYLKAARANLKLARWTKAQEMLRRIIEQFPESFESNVAKQLLEEKEYFTVQVGSFSEKFRAEKLVAEMGQRGEYAYIVDTRAGAGKSVYRVRVGQLSALNDAKELETKLSGLGYPTLIYP